MTTGSQRTEPFMREITTNPEARDDFVTALAGAFRSKIKDEITEGKLIAIDYMNQFVYGSSICATHDYCDANEPMAAALSDALLSATGKFPLSVTDLMNEYPVVVNVWNTAWDKAKANGYSTLWEHKASLDDEEALKTLATVLLVHPHVLSMTTKAYPFITIDVDDEDAFDDASRRAVEAIPSNHDRLPLLAAEVKAAYDTGDATAVVALLSDFADAAPLSGIQP